ncbi:hypothetical protein ACFU5P_13480 [Streptomyces sp. NPDC057433]|uniref:hypothetical protein n=1 Tax=Streptomyces sp. NPDC057433 TaxID=3346132 RepID=UPI0036CB563F
MTSVDQDGTGAPEGPGAVSEAVSGTDPAATRSRRPLSRRRVRLAVAAAGLAGALALTGCSSDGDSGDDPSTPTAAPSAPADGDPDGGTEGTDEPDGSDASGAPAGELEGSWLTTADGRAVALMFTGERAALFATGGTVCSGTAQEDAGTATTISLDCADGDGDRANGTVDSVSGSTLKVTWEGSLGTETYTKAEGGRLPSGLPTAGLGS